MARELPQSRPGMFRGLWPLLLATSDDDRARDAINELQASPARETCWNRGIVGYAEAVMAGRTGDTERASELTRTADAELTAAPVWAAIVRLHSAPAALADGWGQPYNWLQSAGESFVNHGLDALAQRSSSVLGVADDRFARLGLTAREADVFELVAEGLANKEIAIRLGVSPRTVEKHVENLLRKTDARSRTHLVAVVREGN